MNHLSLPVPQDDGAAGHLPGMKAPGLALLSTAAEMIRLDALGPGRTVLYLYPLTGRPGTDLPEGWDSIPGARGCTPEACGFRDHHRTFSLRARPASLACRARTLTTSARLPSGCTCRSRCFPIPR
jgi:hypothetical protein